MDNLLLHISQRLASELFPPPILMWHFKMTNDVYNCPGRFLSSWVLLSAGLGIPVDFTVAAELLKKAADLKAPERLKGFGPCFRHGQGINASTAEVVWHYQRATHLSDADRFSRFGGRLESSKEMNRDLPRVVKYYQLSSAFEGYVRPE
jgi:TPR repeat protein